jgi:hypothetical protein
MSNQRENQRENVKPFGPSDEEIHQRQPDIELPCLGGMPDSTENYTVALKMSHVLACRKTQTIFGNRTQNTICE